MNSNILDLIFSGESQTLEFKTSVRDPKILSSLISSFANSEGGKILIGIKEPPEIVGVDKLLTLKVFEAAMRNLTPQAEAKLSFISEENKDVAVIDVIRSSEIVLSGGRAFARAGTMTQPMAWDQVLRHLPEKPNSQTIESLAKAITEQSKIIEDMSAQLRETNSWGYRWKERGIAFVLGVAASIFAAVIIA